MSRFVAIQFTLLVFALGCSPMARAEDSKDKLGDFLTDVSAGNVSAADLLGLPASAVTTIHAPKDFAAFIGGLNSDKAKQGIGLSFTPGRSSLAPVSISAYENSVASRVWAGTTLSYAQNRQTYGSVEYRQDAVALNGNFYLHAAEDPAVAVHRAFATCVPVSQAMQGAALAIAAETEKVRQEIIATQKALGKSEAEARATANELAESLARPRADALRRDMRERAVAAAAQCVDDAAKTAGGKWNASQISYTIGAARLHGAGHAAPRLSLGRSVSLSAALNAGENALANLTLKHTSKALDTATLASTPVYKGSTVVAARWTYGHGDKSGLFVLAEISNAKSSRATVDNNAFKMAFGIDKRIFDGGWLEFRVGRKRSAESGKDETVGLLSFKLSPAPALPKLSG